jgi:hypothetical protein
VRTEWVAQVSARGGARFARGRWGRAPELGFCPTALRHPGVLGTPGKGPKIIAIKRLCGRLRIKGSTMIRIWQLSRRYAGSRVVGYAIRRNNT